MALCKVIDLFDQGVMTYKILHDLCPENLRHKFTDGVSKSDPRHFSSWVYHRFLGLGWIFLGLLLFGFFHFGSTDRPSLSLLGR